MLAQRTHRAAWPASKVAPLVLDPLVEKPFRLLRLFFIITDTGTTGLTPILRHKSPGGDVLGEWWSFKLDDGEAAIEPGDGARVTFSTAQPPPGILRGYDAAQEKVMIHINIPQDLVIQKNETLELFLQGATAPGSGETEVGSELFFTIAIEP